jgi:hypothetical protein
LGLRGLESVTPGVPGCRSVFVKIYALGTTELLEGVAVTVTAEALTTQMNRSEY